MTHSDPGQATGARPSSEDERASVSVILQRLTVGLPEERISIADLQKEFGERTYGLMLLVFTLPNCLPIPGIPGVSLITGLPVVFFALQLALGREQPYLPAWLRNRAFTRGQISHLMVKAGPKLRWIETMIRPRYAAAVSGLAERALGVTTLVLALTLTLPIPFGNLMPAIGLALLSIALIERDGLLALIGYVTTGFAILWVFVLFLGAEQLLRQIFHLA